MGLNNTSTVAENKKLGRQLGIKQMSDECLKARPFERKILFIGQ